MKICTMITGYIVFQEVTLSEYQRLFSWPNASVKCSHLSTFRNRPDPPIDRLSAMVYGIFNLDHLRMFILFLNIVVKSSSLRPC